MNVYGIWMWDTIVYGIYMDLGGSWTNQVVIDTVDLSEFLFSFSSIRGEGIWFGYFEWNYFNWVKLLLNCDKSFEKR